MMFQLDDVKRILGDIKLILEELSDEIVGEDAIISDEERSKRETVHHKLLYLQKNCEQSTEIHDDIKAEIDGLCRLYDRTMMVDPPHHFGENTEVESRKKGYQFFHSYIDVILMHP